MTISRLWRKLGASSNVFELYSPIHGLVNDDELMSVTVTRGNSEASGLAVSALTASVRRPLAQCPANRSLLRFRLTAYGKSLLDALTAPGTNGDLQRRFEGKIVTQRVEDRGDSVPQRKRWVSQMQCAEWLSLLQTVERGAAVTRERPTQNYIIDSLIRRSALPPAQTETPVAFLGTHWHRRYFAPTDPGVIQLTTNDALSTWLVDMGSLLRTTRSGQVQVLSLDYRGTQGEAWQTVVPQPLLRSQCVAPTSWVQDPTVPHAVRWTDRDPSDPAGTLITHQISVGKLGDVDAYPTETLDLTQVVPAGPAGLNDAMTARVFRTSPDRYQVERLTVDLLHLLSSPRAADRIQARQLLTAEIGDPITLAYDWPTEVAGVKYLTQITETLTPDSWVMELDLESWNRVAGRPDPPAAGRTWHTAYPRGTTWNNVPSTPWNEAP